MAPNSRIKLRRNVVDFPMKLAADSLDGIQGTITNYRGMEVVFPLTTLRGGRRWLLSI
jgi:hypothetical protein